MHWLLEAFIICRELPIYLRKVSGLLASMCIFSSISGSFIVPLSTKKLSLKKWAAYFHNVSVGGYIHFEYKSCARDNNCSTSEEAVNMFESVINESDIHRFAPEKREQLEAFVKGFFDSLPGIPIVCVSMLSGDYLKLIEKALIKEETLSFPPAWMLVTRFYKTSQPISMLLPVALIDKGIDNNASERNFELPWRRTLIDQVAPSFKQIFRENSLLLANVPSDKDGLSEFVLKMKSLDDRLRGLLESMECSWLGPWSCLFLGAHSDKKLEVMVSELIKNFKSHFKSKHDGYILRVIGSATSVTDAMECIRQLLLYKGYFGRGSCFEKERFLGLSHELDERMLADIECFLSAAKLEEIDREPIIFVLDSDVQMLPWECLPKLMKQEVYRMPSIGSIPITIRCNQNRLFSKNDNAVGTIFPSIDPNDAYYLVNPGNDLSYLMSAFNKFVKCQLWQGRAGVKPPKEELVLALKKKDLFIYVGHGSGLHFVSHKEIQELDHCAGILLIGCSSGCLDHTNVNAHAPIIYLLAGSPFIISNLWDVTSGGIWSFTEYMLKSWMDNENYTILKEKVDKRRKPEEGNLKGERKRRIAGSMSEARLACKYPFLVGAAPVCYGVPTLLRRKYSSYYMSLKPL